jgi:hypothetical protein
MSYDILHYQLPWQHHLHLFAILNPQKIKRQIASGAVFSSFNPISIEREKKKSFQVYFT